MHEILYKRPEINPVATCSSSSGLLINKESVSDTSQGENKIESSFMKKKRSLETSVDRRHQEKMQRLDKLQGSLDKMIDILAKKPQQPQTEGKK